jgi:hypothetical protein
MLDLSILNLSLGQLMLFGCVNVSLFPFRNGRLWLWEGFSNDLVSP